MAVYSYKNNLSQLTKAVRHSLSLKKKSGWSRMAGPGFLAEEIISAIWFEKKVTVRTPAYEITAPLLDFNLRETEELLKWIQSIKRGVVLNG